MRNHAGRIARAMLRRGLHLARAGRRGPIEPRRIGLLALAALAVAPPAAAQTAARPALVGYLGSSGPSVEPHYVEAFRDELRRLGYVEGQQIRIVYRWAEGHDERLPGLATELVRLKPDVIVTTGTPGAFAAKHATRTIPVVMASAGDPVRSGLVASLARPGGNVTGMTVLGPELEAKRLGLLKQALPKISRVAVLWNPANPAIHFYFEETKRAAALLQLTLDPVTEVRGAEELDGAFAAMARARPDALVVLADRLLLAHRHRIVEFAVGRRLPGMYAYRGYADVGGLMAYAPSDVELFKSAARYVDKILKGARPQDLPVQEPSKFELVVNLKAARALGLTLPQSILQQADQLIE
jgi:putative ABC transport system substrate-binding protein